MTKGNFDRFESFDEYALRIARRIVAIDQHRLKGGKSQYQAIIQDAIVDAMHEAVSDRKPATPAQDRDALALAAMTDEQAVESLNRFKVMREDYVAAVLELRR